MRLILTVSIGGEGTITLSIYILPSECFSCDRTKQKFPSDRVKFAVRDITSILGPCESAHCRGTTGRHDPSHYLRGD